MAKTLKKKKPMPVSVTTPWEHGRKIAEKLLTEQRVTLSRHGDQVSIMCDDNHDAACIMEWLESIACKLTRTSP